MNEPFKTKKKIKIIYFLLVIITHTLYSNELWMGIDAGIGFTKFIKSDFIDYKAKMRPGFVSGINFIHKPFKMFSVKYGIGYNQQRSAFISELGIPITVFNKETGEIDSIGEIIYDYYIKYSLNTMEVFIQPFFQFFIRQRSFSLSFSPGIGIVYRFQVKQYFNNFGDPFVESYNGHYNKFDIPIIVSIGILYRVNEIIQLSLNNNVYFGTKKFQEEKSNHLHSPSLKMAGYQVVVNINYRLFSSN